MLHIWYDPETHRIIQAELDQGEGPRGIKTPKRAGHLGYVLRELERLGEARLEDHATIIIEVIHG